MSQSAGTKDEAQKKARAARFASATKAPSGLRSKGDATLTLEEQKSLLARLKSLSPDKQEYPLRQLRESVVSCGPSEFAGQAFSFAIQIDLENNRPLHLQSMLRHLIEVVAPKYPVEKLGDFEELLVVVLSGTNLPEAYELAAEKKVRPSIWAYLRALAVRDYLSWSLILEGEKNHYLRKAMKLQDHLLQSHFKQVVSKAYRKETVFKSLAAWG